MQDGDVEGRADGGKLSRNEPLSSTSAYWALSLLGAMVVNFAKQKPVALRVVLILRTFNLGCLSVSWMQHMGQAALMCFVGCYYTA